MLKTAILSVFTVLIFLGIVSICFYFSVKFLHSKDEGRYIVLIAADKDKHHVSEIMSSEKMRLELLNEKGSVVVLDFGMDEKEKQICDNLCRTSSGMYVIAPDKINELCLKEGL